uniref:Protein phosphatase 1 regulatory subunit 21 C-terminal domain-containing protein n=1 Tax=Timema douglasi TaxID=61478 RepID=A0A7R8VL12_TIMDO|nr:unnamed protein product [Timema douglasi]
MNSNGVKPRSGDLAVMIDFLRETANTYLSSGSNKLNEFENKLKAGNLERNNIQTALNSFDRSAPTSVTNMLGSLDCPLPPLQAEAEAREQEVKNYFTNRINELVVVSQETETKAAILAGECSSLQHRLELCQSGKQQSAEDLSEALEKLTRLQEELQTTTENYEVQLSIMSEHLANMNEKLTLQRDEIDQLKYQLTSKMVGLKETGEIAETTWRGLVECKIPLTSVDMGIMVGRGLVSVDEAEQHIMSARALVYIWTREFMEALLCLLANNGPVATRSVYRDIIVEDFILRFLIQRCKYNYGANETYCTLSGHTAYVYKHIVASRGKACLKYFEIVLSGLIGVPSTTRFINKGERDNMGHPMAEGVVKQGSIVGLVGPNLRHAGLADSLFMSPNPDSKPVFRFIEDYFKSRVWKPNKIFPVKHGVNNNKEAHSAILGAGKGDEVLVPVEGERKRAFEDGLTEEKKDCERYVKGELRQGPWGIPFRIASGKIRPLAMMSALKRTDGSTTTCWEETAEFLMETLLPDDEEGETE